ncbi:hypothetical protein PVAP13_8NG072702 [Panicum virgatum]|uniref:Uncharacterized protein n=1 Tax=Panicum virgatum TaxID=38727 RepID=A0A8T0P2K2_PANVG|nr:hypothetical protein PVAP13_8NG072702 [Panicum virgatum]
MQSPGDGHQVIGALDPVISTSVFHGHRFGVMRRHTSSGSFCSFAGWKEQLRFCQGQWCRTVHNNRAWLLMLLIFGMIYDQIANQGLKFGGLYNQYVVKNHACLLRQVLCSCLRTIVGHISKTIVEGSTSVCVVLEKLMLNGSESYFDDSDVNLYL